ncbi:neuroligin-4, X-linked-like [Littorina saxatilis]|uniref:neuroligin-4, X-linked-like n=1 Tax=Littorina saxatilis TaxID=31220 RepID=UPI0038B6964D
MTVVLVWGAALFLLTNIVSVSPAPLTDAPWGQIRGVSVSSGDDSYSAYLAIPYALPPVGGRRFAKPVPHPGPGPGQVHEAVAPGAVCPQLDPFFQGMFSEDCLTLDVYVPTELEGPTSVLIYIHGGSFAFWGSRIFTPSELVTENDVIVVVIQYRLGALGFLSSGDDALPGNYGLWDQNLAIQWVKDNIRAFGGDPDSMTIYGQSAGAVSVGHQLLSPYSKGLFSRAILQSGVPLSVWAVNEDPSQPFDELARAVGCVVDASQGKRTVLGRSRSCRKMNIVACLRQVPVNELLVMSVLPVRSVRSSDILKWLPVVDGDFVPRNPAELLCDADYLTANDVISRDVMLGVNNDEDGYLLDAIKGTIGLAQAVNPGADLTELIELFSISNKTERNLIREALLYYFAEEVKENPGNIEKAVDMVETYYTDSQVTLESAAATFGDIYFNVPMVAMARDLAEVSAGMVEKGSLYVYTVNHFPARKGQSIFKGIEHGEDIPYVFDNAYFSRDGFTDDDFAVGAALRAALANFAKTGNPNTPEDLASDVAWPEFSLATQSYLSLGPTSNVSDHLYAAQADLWLEEVPDTLFDDSDDNKDLD